MRVPTHLHLLASRMGRRGKFLIYAGVVEALIGYGYLADPVIRRPGVFVVHDLVPIPWWGVAWILLGLFGVAFAWTTEPGRDRIGFGAIILMPSLQAASYVVSWLLHLTGNGGDPRGIFTALLFIGLARFLGVAAGWPEARPLQTSRTPAPQEEV